MSHDLELENEWLKRENLALHNAVTELRRLDKQKPWTDQQRKFTVEMVGSAFAVWGIGAFSICFYVFLCKMFVVGVLLVLASLFSMWAVIRVFSGHWDFWNGLDRYVE